MESTEATEASSLQQTIEGYEAALVKVESSQGSPAEAEVLELLIARDRVESTRAAAPLSAADSVRLLGLDQRLRHQAAAITTAVSLADCRTTLTPPSSAWWWSLEPPAPRVPKLDQFDWVWNLLTVTCLVFSASFATHTARAFSTQGFDLMGTISTITQGAGVALVAGGALTDKGRRVTENVLRSLKIAPEFYAEATFCFSAALLGTTFLLNSNLPKVGDTYQRQGDRHLSRGNLVSARNKYLRALDFDAHDEGLMVAAGDVSVRLGDLDQAETFFRQGMALDNAAAMDGLARTLIIKELEAKGWNAKIDDLVARRADFYLDAALNQTRSDSDLRAALARFLDQAETQAGLVGPRLSAPERAELADLQQALALKASVYTNQGLLKLSLVDFDNLDAAAAATLLTEAATKFEAAVIYENALLDLLDAKLLTADSALELGKADCYRTVVAQVRAEVAYQPGDNLAALFDASNQCYTQLRSQRLNRFDDAILYYRLGYTWDTIPNEAYEAPATKPAPEP